LPPFADIALKFAQALVDADYAAAFLLLSPDMQRHLSPVMLESKLVGRHSRYAPRDKPRSAVLGPEFIGTDWPERFPGDVGWAYVSIIGEEFVEGVTVTVSIIDGHSRIRDVEWGRP
jgi:hypothetical protein